MADQSGTNQSSTRSQSVGLSPAATFVFGGLVQQTEQGAAYISLLAMNPPASDEVRKRALDLIRQANQQELFNTTGRGRMSQFLSRDDRPKWPLTLSS